MARDADEIARLRDKVRMLDDDLRKKAMERNHLFHQLATANKRIEELEKGANT